MISRSGCLGSSARESHRCGVITFWPARYTSGGGVGGQRVGDVPPRLGTVTRSTQSGK